MTDYLIDPRNGHKEAVDWDICPGALFFGPFWFLNKGMVGWFFLAIFLNLITLFIAWIPVAAMAHKIHKKWLISRGFVTESHYKQFARRSLYDIRFE